ncbi:hypothetical protein [Streptomyces sp. NBC_00239]|uniref:hypothetical protein n=1 Tax=Streptomyces sp. NBC_00239 TaxID=2903640 RepID=UPI002E2A9364|nr:hypothetical protein [Streptomyces sp. NBC_00239]
MTEPDLPSHHAGLNHVLRVSLAAVPAVLILLAVATIPEGSTALSIREGGHALSSRSESQMSTATQWPHRQTSR